MPSVDGEEHEGGEKEEMNKGISRKKLMSVHVSK